MKKEKKKCTGRIAIQVSQNNRYLGWEERVSHLVGISAVGKRVDQGTSPQDVRQILNHFSVLVVLWYCRVRN